MRLEALSISCLESDDVLMCFIAQILSKISLCLPDAAVLSMVFKKNLLWLKCLPEALATASSNWLIKGIINLQCSRHWLMIARHGQLFLLQRDAEGITRVVMS